MKVAIIGFCNLNIMQYLYKYTNILDQAHIRYDVIYWNRLGIHEEKNFKGTKISYNHEINTYQPFHKKIKSFLEYAIFIRRIIKHKKYDKLIILTTQSAIVLTDLLLVKYRKRYVYDYRDITKEKKSKLYNMLVKKIIKKSFCTMMSSEGFSQEIGLRDKSNIQIAHNTQLAEKSCYEHRIKQDVDPIKIVFWGIVRQLEYNKKICDCFGNDKRFELIFHGTGEYKELNRYCQRKKYKNVYFTGVFNQKDIAGFADETDILHCVYENDEEQKPAMPVKAYDAIKYRLPVLINRDCQVEKFFKGIQGALAIDILDKKATDLIYEWYRNLDEKIVKNNYQDLEEKVLQDDISFKNRLKDFVGEVE